jgi:spore coat polysaccharide biosynthesis protein SpsF
MATTAMNVSVLRILQARMSSSRLPGKILMPLTAGKPLLQLMVERVSRAKTPGKLIVATTASANDDQVENLCKHISVPCFRGSEHDVLDRFYKAALCYNSDHIIRLTGDCPIIDPDLLDEIVKFYFKGGFDYASNTVEPSFPDGLDVEIFSFTALKQAWEEAKLSSQREHVTPFIHQQPGRFNIGSFKSKENLSSMRWTVDGPEDFQLVSRIYEILYPANPFFSTEDVLHLFDQMPELALINSGIKRNAGYEESIKKDAMLRGDHKIEHF